MAYSLIRDGDEIALEGDEVLIGRGAACAVRLDDPAASRQHCKLILEGTPAVVDLDTPNGVLVNGDRIVERTELRSGALITIGAVELSFVKSSPTSVKPSSLRISRIVTCRSTSSSTALGCCSRITAAIPPVPAEGSSTRIPGSMFA